MPLGQLCFPSSWRVYSGHADPGANTLGVLKFGMLKVMEGVDQCPHHQTTHHHNIQVELSSSSHINPFTQIKNKTDMLLICTGVELYSRLFSPHRIKKKQKKTNKQTNKKKKKTDYVAGPGKLHSKFVI